MQNYDWKKIENDRELREVFLFSGGPELVFKQFRANHLILGAKTFVCADELTNKMNEISKVSERGVDEYVLGYAILSIISFFPTREVDDILGKINCDWLLYFKYFSKKIQGKNSTNYLTIPGSKMELNKGEAIIIFP